MSLNYTTLPIQLAQELVILRKREAIWEHVHPLFSATSANVDRRLLVAANAYSTSVDEEAQALATDLAKLDGQISPMASIWSDYRATIGSSKGFAGVVWTDAPVVTDADKAAGAIKYNYTDTAGVIAISERLGWGGALRRQMVLDTNYVLANAITFGSFTAASGNVGTLAVTSMTGESHALSGTLIFEVVDDTVSAPKIRVTNKLTRPLPDVPESIVADRQLQPEKSFEDGPTALTMVLTRSGLAAPTEAGDGGAMFASSSISSPSEADSNKGKIFIKVTRQATAPIWLIQWYKDSALTGLVQQATTDTILTTYAVDMTGAGGMRFQSTFDRVAADVALPAAGNTDSDITFDMLSPRKGDRWTRTVTNDYVGLYSTKIAHSWRFSLPVSGAGTMFTDANATSLAVT